MSTGIIQNFKPVNWEYYNVTGTYSGGVDQEKARGYGTFTGEGANAEWRLEGEWEDNCMRRGEMKMGGLYAGKRYVGEFDGDGRFRGSGKLSWVHRGWLWNGERHFDGEWERLGYALGGTAEECDGAVFRVAFEGGGGAFWHEMERAFDEKQSYRRDSNTGGTSISNLIGGVVTGASWTLLPVSPPTHRSHSAR
jgi:hypothetical protein